MSRIRPFKSFSPRPQYAARVASVPYDVVDTEEARGLAEGNPDSFLRVIRSEIELEDDATGDEVRARACENLERLVRRGVVVREERPVLFVYRLEARGRRQTGVVGLYDLAEVESGLIKRHEHVRPPKVEERARLMHALGAQSGPVFLTHRPREALARCTSEVCAREATIDFEAVDGVRHTLWRVAEPAALVEAFRTVPAIYIADGHHRVAAAARVWQERGGDPADPASGFLGVSFASDEVGILPYHRVVKDLDTHTPASFVAQLAQRLEPLEHAGPEPRRRGEVSVYVAGRWRGFALPREGTRLDVDLLHAHVLEPVLGIGDPRTDPRLDFVGGGRGWEDLVRRVEAGRAAAAFSMHPVSIDDLLEVADRGETMPPKSTWFEPKLRSGLFVHVFAP